MVFYKAIRRCPLGPLTPGFILIAAATLQGQVVRGRVVDDSTGLPVAAASLVLITTAGTASVAGQSAANGQFRLTVPQGEYVLRVQRIGYREWSSSVLSVRADQELEVTPRLTPSAVELEAAEVVGQPSGRRRALVEFERRREAGLGKFITRAEFEKSTPRQVTDILLRMPGLRIVRNPCYMMDATQGPCYNRAIGGADTRRYVLRPRGGPTTFGNADRRAASEDCGVLVYVDGRYVGDGLRVDLDFVPVEQVEAIEVYSGASQIPTELNRTGSACGVIVIWTR
jgi:hypothetical protein